jgi:hypothetical protein
MQTIEPEKIEWLDPWMPVSRAEEAEGELPGAIQPGHPLHGRTCLAIARRCDRRDYLFHIPDSSSPLALVRFRSHPDESGPQTVFFNSVEAWIEHCMKPDAEDFFS